MPEICAIVSCVGDARALAAAGVQRVYLDVIDLEPTDEVLGEAWAQGLVPLLDEVCRESDHARLDPWVVRDRPVAVGNVSELSLARQCGAQPELRSCVPAHNLAMLEAMASLGARFAWLSSELSLAEVRELAQATPIPLGIRVFGRPRLMTCEHCVLQVAHDCDGRHETCPYRGEPHWLVNIDGRRLPVSTDRLGCSRVFLDEPVDLIPAAAELAAMGLARLLVDARMVSPREAADACGRLADALAGGRVGAVGTMGLARLGVE